MVQMKDQNKTKKQLMSELAALREQVSEVRKVKYKGIEPELDLGVLEHALAHSINAIGITDMEGKLIYANSAGVKMWGYDKEEEVLGKNLLELFEGDQVRETIKELHEKGARAGVDTGKKKDGSLFSVRFAASVIRDDSGDPKYMFGSFIDISEQKKIEKEMLMANERLQYLLSTTSAVIYSARTSGDYGATFITDNVTQMTGYKPKDFIDKANFWINHVHPDDMSGIQDEVHRVLDKDYRKYEYRFRIKNGTYIWVRDEMKLVRDEEGHPLEIIGYWIDISEKKKAEEALRESEEKFRSLAEQSPNMIFINKKGRVVYVNRSCEETMGYPIDKFYSPDFDFLCLIAAECRDLIIDNFKKHLKGDELPPYEYVLITKEGKRIESIITTKLIDYENEKAILGFVTDITERKKAEKVLKDSYGMLEQKVNERTKEITAAIRKMEREVKERKLAEGELRKSEERLKKSQAKLQKQAVALEQKNVALREIIAQIEIEKRKIKEDIATNVDTVLSPILEGLKRGKTSQKYVQLLEHHLGGLASSFGSRVKENSAHLTPREIEICSMIRGGLTSKDISRLLNISGQTVEKHRKNIRRKFGISNRGINLTSFLREF